MLVDGSLATNATLSGTGNLYSLNGSFFLELNTTSTARTNRPSECGITDDLFLAPVSAQLRVSGSLVVGGFTLNGFFLMAVQSGEFQLRAGWLQMSFRAIRSLNVSSNVKLSSAGMAGSFVLNAGGGVHKDRIRSGSAKSLRNSDVNTRTTANGRFLVRPSM